MDDIDRAKQREVLHRDKALEAQLAAGAETESPYEVDGIRYCLDCHDEIPEERIKARPESVRCVPCKEKKEQRKRNYR
ncbi:MAG: TraR/DksA C4-type zinc finger protein [Candidatus Sedimenticola sp. (ex Thyasira tokunagai)]